MAGPAPSPLFQQFVDDELLRAPMLFDQVLDAVLDGGRRLLASLGPAHRQATSDWLLAVQAQRTRLTDHFVASLRRQVASELSAAPRPDRSAHASQRPAPQALALVDEDEVAIEVELAHAIEAIKTAAEYELRELETYVAAVAGDLDIARDHNPFRPAAFARAAWAAAQALPLSRGHQVAFMRQCAEPLAQLLRTSCAASTSRLESQGVEPASHRTLILPSGSRRGGRSVQTTYNPDLRGIRASMPTGTAAAPGARTAGGATDHEDHQTVELVSRLFEALIADRRLPPDVAQTIGRLSGPAQRLALRERTLLDQDRHPLWQCIDQLVFFAEVSPGEDHPDRQELLHTARAALEPLASEPAPHTAQFRWACEQLQAVMAQRLQRRLAVLASQIARLQLIERQPERRSTLSGPLDAHQLDTVPAEFIDTGEAARTRDESACDAWLASLRVGGWLRVFLSGRWWQVQLLWASDQGLTLLLGDVASEETWAVRRRALARLHQHGLAMVLRGRPVVARAAQRVQQAIVAASAA